jgi:hypothetical protein
MHLGLPDTAQDRYQSICLGVARDEFGFCYNGPECPVHLASVLIVRVLQSLSTTTKKPPRMNNLHLSVRHEEWALFA